MEHVANEYVTYARQLTRNGCFNKAFDFYIAAFDKNPQLKAHSESEFRKVLIQLNEVMAMNNRIEDIFNNFGRALKAFPENTHLLNDIGKYLYKFGLYTEAWCHFQRALKLDSGFVNPEKNLNSIKNLLVERWHFRMLNDKIRNESYRQAIRASVVSRKDTVLDLGTGTGLLALYAAECCPTAVTACDGSEVMSKLADTILEENNTNTPVLVVNNMSTDMVWRDIGGKRSLLVTEMFDAGLFGEHVLQSLLHAKQQLITDEARVVPNKGEFFIIGAKSDHLNLKYQLSSTIKKTLNVAGLNVHALIEDETYDCEDIHLIKDFEYMTEAQSVIQVDFRDYNDMQYKLNRTEPFHIELKALKKGEINVLIGFFKLYLTENITITTDPRSENRANAWQQAVFFDFLPHTVEEDQPINLKILMNRGKLTLVPKPNTQILRVSPETIRFLNDPEYVKMITRCLGMASVYVGQMTEMSQVTMVDLCPFPMFGLLMLKRGIQTLTCWAKTESDKKFFKKVFKANKIPMSRINMLIGDDWTQDVFRDEKFHAIFCNIFELCGDIDLRMREIAQHLKHANLVHGGLFMPSNINIVAQIVNSSWLDINNRIYDSNISNYKVAKHMNKYRVSQNFCIDYSCLEYTALSEPTVLGRYAIGVRTGGVLVPIEKDGEANAILCSYNIEIMEGLGEVCTSRGNSFIDGAVFLTSQHIRMARGHLVQVSRCIDSDGAFKLMIDTS